MKYVLIYDNPVRPYVIGITHDTEAQAHQRLVECLGRGIREEHLSVVPANSDEAKGIAECKHMF